MHAGMMLQEHPGHNLSAVHGARNDDSTAAEAGARHPLAHGAENEAAVPLAVPPANDSGVVMRLGGALHCHEFKVMLRVMFTICRAQALKQQYDNIDVTSRCCAQIRPVLSINIGTAAVQMTNHLVLVAIEGLGSCPLRNYLYGSSRNRILLMEFLGQQ